METRRINRMVAEQTARQMGLNISQVQTIIRQYADAVKKIVGKMDLENITKEEYLALKKRGIYVPGLGKFITNWKIIEAYQNKHSKYDDKD